MARFVSATARLTATAALGYLAGTVPSADVASRLAGGPDLRHAGSGNPGAANAAAVLGPGFGLAVLAVDIAKGAAAGGLGWRVAGPNGAHVGSVAAVAGHCYPLWSGFRGGKGVATSVGQVLVTFPAWVPLDLAVAVATAAVPWWKQRAFAATTVASASWIAASVTWWRRGLPNLWGPRPSAALPVAAAVTSAVIFHRFRTARRPAPGPATGGDQGFAEPGRELDGGGPGSPAP